MPKWLADSSNRRQGRTEVLIRVYLILAVENPGRRIELKDHYSTRRADRNLRVRLEKKLPKFAYSLKREGFFEVKDTSIKFFSRKREFGFLALGGKDNGRFK